MSASERNERLLSAIRAQVAESSAFATLRERLAETRVGVTGASAEARALLLASLQQEVRRKLAIIVPGDTDLREIETSLRLFHRSPECVAVYPNPSLSPYQEVTASLAVVRDEIRALARLIDGSADVLLIPARALFRRLPTRESFSDRTIRIERNADLDVRATLERLVDGGYTRTDLVGEVGDFAFRGGIIDLFSPTDDRPVRIELFGDTVDSIRYFDPETQRSAEEVSRLDVHPLTHFPVTKATRGAVARRLSLDFMDPHYKRDVAEKIERLQEHGSFSGMEHVIPIATSSVTFSDYFNADEWSIVQIEPEEVASSLDKYESLLRADYEAASDKGEAVYAPHQLLVSHEEIFAFLRRSSLAFADVVLKGAEYEELRISAPAGRTFVNALTEVPNALAEGHNNGRRQIIFVATRGGREKVERVFQEFSIPFVHDGDRLSDEITVTHGHLPQGFDFPAAGLQIFSEWDLFEPPTSSARTTKRRKTEAFITDLRDLKAGDLIVHVDHGVGRFLGLQRIPFGDTDREVMQLEYANGGRLLLPMESLNLIQKYSGGGDEAPKLDKLGGTSWARTKASVKKAMRDMADELLKLYATRQMVKGHAFNPDTPWQHDFEESFEFDETDDQLAAIEDIKNDMESRKPMDRLVCGDVGYGKTEVAMRAAFKAVMDGKQVAVLAPTTILAYQHYRTFLRRFASFPVTVELVSRLRSAKEQKEIAAKVASGEIDVLIGTHRILSKDMAFKDIGLVIIDEEQRFGVGQKEKLKHLKKTVDVLSMSATPIPRTLNMSMVGIRDISVIETPPKDRLAIQTAVVPFKDELIREAIDFEISRGGQVFFVHNRIESIYQMKEYLEKLVPGLRVIVGHGQMDEQELEKAMMAFIAREYDVLLATTIIENGIDIPACNTILINHAERMGLSQLYQLRGRVGRSDRLAFCYLLVPSQHVLSSDARKRLSAIQEFSDLGAGFRIAAKDLEIRGAGNLLGGEQSGQIAAVGFEMYTRLLEETIRELKGEKVEEEIDTSMTLAIDIYIPRDYIADENQRMIFYKRIASARDEKRLEEIRAEMRDRFGALPENVENLFEFVRLKHFAQEIGVVSIVRERPLVNIKFHPSARINPNKLLEIVSSTGNAKFTPAGILSIPLRSDGRQLIEDIGAVLATVALETHGPESGVRSPE